VTSKTAPSAEPAQSTTTVTWPPSLVWVIRPVSSTGEGDCVDVAGDDEQAASTMAIAPSRPGNARGWLMIETMPASAESRVSLR
jgi:hypothetical protein